MCGEHAPEGVVVGSYGFRCARSVVEATSAGVLAALASEDPGVRAEAARLAGTAGVQASDAIESALLDALGDEDPLVREYATRSLGRVMRPGRLESILEEVIAGRDLSLEEQLVDALLDRHETTALATYRRAFEKPGAALRLRFCAAFLLADLGDEAGSRLLVEQLRGRQRGMAVLALWQLGDPAAIPAILDAYAGDEDALRQYLNGYVRDRIGQPELCRVVDHPEPGARGYAAYLLGLLRDAEAAPALERMATADPEESVRDRAALARIR